MNELRLSIDKQIEFNKGKNLYFTGSEGTLKFICGTIAAIEKTGELSNGCEKILVDYTTDKVLQEFCRINQYFAFNSQSKRELREVYVQLFADIKNKAAGVPEISVAHSAKLKRWLEKANPFAYNLYSSHDEYLNPVACSEYSAELQIDLLHVRVSQIREPFLDIGCGKQCELVRYLSINGIDATGLDRFAPADSSALNANWLEFDYGTDKWGTIVSNLGFSNHFLHHHLRNDGDFVRYATKYMDILRSLKVNGSFHYAPDLPFIEQYLDPGKFSVAKHSVANYEYITTIITRLA